MEISGLVDTQLVFPGIVVAFVVLCAGLVFAFGFKKVDYYPVDKFNKVVDERKSGGKKRKLKDKKSQSNGQVTAVPESKQKSNENSKVAGNKAKTADKSQVKDGAKVSAKQEKKNPKQDNSPVKEALKDNKNIKESNKINNENQKQAKVKDVQKQGIDQQSNKQTKGSKGKENVDVKNNKNIIKSKKNKIEENYEDDGGEWEQAPSRKDKKKAKPLVAENENMAGKTVKKDTEKSPGKKKKSKPTPEPEVNGEPIPQVTVPAPAPTVQDVQETPDIKEKPVKKEKEEKKEKKEEAQPKPKEEVVPVVESIAPNAENEGESKTAKKKKKKAVSKDNTEAEPTTVKEKPVAKEIVEVVSAPVAAKEPEPEVKAAVFDELGDTWEETKAQKKASKKKVRKAE